MNVSTRQPVITAGVIVTAIAAAVLATNAFGLTHVTDEQLDALKGAVVAMWPLLLIIRTQVTPAAAPRLPEGTSVTLHDGTQGTVTKA